MLLNSKHALTRGEEVFDRFVLSTCMQFRHWIGETLIAELVDVVLQRVRKDGGAAEKWKFRDLYL